MNKHRILVTGANGFIGRALVCTLLKSNYSIRILTHSSKSARQLRDEVSTVLDIYSMNDVIESEQWEAVFKDVDTVIHCGAQLYPSQKIKDTQQQFMKSNYDTTINLAKNAINNNVRRFIFLSSMSVFGNMRQYIPFTETTPLIPIDSYGLSKLEAEKGLREFSDKIELVIIRPPLVYGPGVKNNFKKLFSLIHKGMPLPLGAIKNKRHFIGINKLIDFIITCISSEKAKNEEFIVKDNEALSTTELIQHIGKAMNKKNRLIPVPSRALEFMLKTAGLSRLAEQLFYNIEIDFSKAKRLLHWTPPYSLQEELQLSVEHFLKEKTSDK